MKLKLYDELYQVTKLVPNDEVPINIFQGAFYSITRTNEELSIVCPQNLDFSCESREIGWRILKIEGMLDFSLIGILSKISTILAENKVSIFVISTYNTDYILVKNTDISTAIRALKENGYSIDP